MWLIWDKYFAFCHIFPTAACSIMRASTDMTCPSRLTSAAGYIMSSGSVAAATVGQKCHKQQCQDR
ncbi:hypothetical protein DRO03_10255, partial [Methanosarcinales archaeon]